MAIEILLQEDGDGLMLEQGGYILLEESGDPDITFGLNTVSNKTYRDVYKKHI